MNPISEFSTLQIPTLPITVSGGEVGFVGDEGEARTRTKSSEPLVGEASICRRDFDVWRIVVWGAQDLWFL